MNKITTHNALFITDLDGTLLTDDKLVGTPDRAGLAKLRQGAITTAIATGRSLYSFNKLLAGSGFSAPKSFPYVDYLIFSTGAGVFDFSSGNILQPFSLTTEDVDTIAGYLEEIGVDYMIHAPIPDTNLFLFRKNNRNNPDFDTRISIYRAYGTPLASCSKSEIGTFSGATEILCIVDGQSGHKTASMISERLSQYSVIKATSPLDGKSLWIEIFAAGVSKSNSAHRLAHSLGIDRGKVCAVGNDYNDEDLLNWAGTSYIVDNGPDSLKRRFTTVPSNNNGGVRCAINDWLAKLAQHEPYHIHRPPLQPR